MRDILQRVQISKEFDDEEIYNIFSNILDKKYSELEIAAFLFGLSIRGENPNELYNLVKILRERLDPVIIEEDAIDVCGTGGDGKNSLNVSSAVALVVAAAGVPVAKHGNAAVSSRSGSADIYKEIGLDFTNATNEDIKSTISKYNFAFLFAPKYHKILANIMPIRKSLGVRTIFNCVGPLINPAGIKRQLIGVYNKDILPLYSKVLSNLEYKKVMVVNSVDGYDEISALYKTNIVEISGSDIKDYQIDPKGFNLNSSLNDSLEGGDIKYNAHRMIELFKGKKDLYRDSVIINSSAALYVSGKYSSIYDAVPEIERILDSGEVLNIIEKIKGNNI